jgi:hypothetical protein
LWDDAVLKYHIRGNKNNKGSEIRKFTINFWRGTKNEKGSEIGKFIITIFGGEPKPKKELRSENLSSQFLAGNRSQKRNWDGKIYHFDFWRGTKTEKGIKIRKFIISIFGREPKPKGREIWKFIFLIFGGEPKTKKEVRSENLSSRFFAGNQNQKRNWDLKIYHQNFWRGTETKKGSEIGKFIISIFGGEPKPKKKVRSENLSSGGEPKPKKKVRLAKIIIVMCQKDIVKNYDTKIHCWGG